MKRSDMLPHKITVTAHRVNNMFKNSNGEETFLQQANEHSLQ